MTERRKNKRRPFEHLAAIARIEDGLRLADCLVRDLSSTGACLVLKQDASLLPDEFALLISKSGNVLRRCRIVWRRTNEIGVAFVAPRKR